ncbi:MAG: helix-turn-helix domain-containing protein [Chthoniobacteraceae bacterium]
MTPLVEPVGRKLAKAREARGLTVEEAALETRIRKSQIAALEADDYSSFASNTYARGFLLIYGKFLGVEVREVARGLQSGNPISIEEYQYLNVVPDAEPSRSTPRRREEAPKNRRPSIAPLIVFILLVGGGAFAFHLYLQAQRLENDAKGASNVESVKPGTTPAPSVVEPPETAANTTSIIPPKPTPAPFANNPDRAFLANTPATPQPASLPQVNELIVEPLKKTWIRIRRDDPNAEPIFDDVLYPKVGALKLKGTRFYIEIREPEAVRLSKNGQAVAYQPPGVTVQ